MVETTVTFLQMPEVGKRVEFMSNGQRMTTSPVATVQTTPDRPGWFVVRTASGNTYVGTYQPDYQPTTFSAPYTPGPPAAPPMPSIPSGTVMGARLCPNCGRPMGPNGLCLNCASGSVQPPRSGRSDEKTWAMLCHILGLVAGFFAPLIIWLTVGKDSRLVIHHAKEALNFAITLCIAGIVTGLLCAICIGYILVPVLIFYPPIAMIIAGIQANKGEYYRYPVCVRFIK